MSANPENPQSFEELVESVKKQIGEDPVDKAIAAIVTMATGYVAHRTGLDHVSVIGLAAAAGIALPGTVRLAANHLHYKRTGERRPILNRRERRYAARALRILSSVLVNLGAILRRKELAYAAVALTAYANTLITADSNIPLHKERPAIAYQLPPHLVPTPPAPRTALTATMQRPWTMGANYKVTLRS